jgi:hypothetical protein
MSYLKLSSLLQYPVRQGLIKGNKSLSWSIRPKISPQYDWYLRTSLLLMNCDHATGGEGGGWKEKTKFYSKTVKRNLLATWTVVSTKINKVSKAGKGL